MSRQTLGTALSTSRLTLCALILSAFACQAPAQTCFAETMEIPADGQSNEWFGYRIAVSGERVLIGAYADGDLGSFAGSAYVWHKVAGVWVQQAELHPGDSAAGDFIGVSVALLNDVAVIGSDGDDDNGNNAGAVYVFRFDGNTWQEEAKLLASDGQPNQSFGRNVSVTTNTILVGSQFDDDNGVNSGSAYIFRFDGNNWIEEQKLLPNDGHPGQLFAFSLGISGPVAVIGAVGDLTTGGKGSAYIFRDDGNSWVQEQELIPGDLTFSDIIGSGAAAFGNLVIVSDHQDFEQGNQAGAAWIFRFDGNTWIEEAKLLASDGQAGDLFGWRRSVSISSNFAMVGAPRGDGVVANCGAAYIYKFDGQQWNEAAKLFAPDGLAGDDYGRSVSFRNATFTVGSPLDHTINGGDSGSAHIYDLLDNCCQADINGDGVVDADDFFAFLDAFAINDLAICDLDNDADCDVDDFFLFLDLFVLGCD